MPDVFLSYNREDQAVARRFAHGLERAGFSVWWDATLNPGEAYDEVTEKALLEAKAVVVLWSPRSVVSRWVRAEATQALESRTLLPVMIEPCKRPIMFELTQTADLTKWNGNPDDPAWQGFVTGVRQFVGRGAPVVNPSTATTTVPTMPTLASPPRKRNALLALALGALLLIAGAIYWAIDRRGPAPTVARSQAAISLAVLPFADLSAEKDQEYFSDGLAEELLNELSQIRELRVAGRTSSFSFKGKNEDLRTIGQKLGVANILEGSVRKSGNRLRITAQLIDAADGSHLWSNAYERELSDLFEVQKEIAMAVTGALSVALDVGAMSRANGGTTNVDAYDKFLQGQALWYRGGTFEVFQNAAQRFREAVQIDPRFGRAWHGLYKAAEQQNVLTANTADLAAVRQTMNEAKERLLELAPQAWFAQSIRVADLVYQHKWAEAEALAAASLAATPRPETALTYAAVLARVGRAKESLPYMRRAAAAEPLSGSMSMSLQNFLDMAGLADEAQAEYVRGSKLEGVNWLADSFAIEREWIRPSPDVARIDGLMRQLHTTMGGMSAFSPIMDHWQDRPRALATTRRVYAELAAQGSGNAFFAMIGDHYGDKEMALEVARTQLIERNGPQIYMLWQFNQSGWRSDPRYKAILRELGLVDYFRSSGKWPDICRPVSSDDFECR